ncbi:concanavalin A-like lectin/glucanases superfamily protein [Terrimicrobium sacchariphilum]|uniref:Concanavalin A-like lectin/glucanases superfamily protein n=1 Tax=Terrimicrobium sacchariphilum TaxID=690879 RepID=A0A146G4J7_TERSA|nr:LamG-like jellyroll fold domain-containing protein [Terrimicrobium sacchariphilum]GAT32352.1 concanavalin A-like lectin/glucanases superfamily protein [Terrimicrobium sacchariphilum]
MNLLTKRARPYLLVCCLSALPGLSPAEDIAHWKLEEGSGQVVRNLAGDDEAVLGFDATEEPQDPQWTAQGWQGRPALYFDGTSLVSAPPLKAKAIEDLTVECRAYLEKSKIGTLVRMNGMFCLDVFPGKDGLLLRFVVWPRETPDKPVSAEAPIAVLPVKEWARIAGVYEQASGKVTLYVEGKEVARNEAGAGGVFTDPRMAVTIGASSGGAAEGSLARGWVGMISEVRLSGTALAPSGFFPEQ